MQAIQATLTAIVPSLAVDDVRGSVAYYVEKLGFKSEGIYEENGVVFHAEVSSGAVRLMFGPAAMAEGTWAELPAGVRRGVGVVLYLSLSEGIDAYYDQVRAAGARIVDEIKDQFWGDRTFIVEDPDGYLLQFAQHVKDFPAEMMPNLKP